jgi:hypothetical protein
LLLCFSLSLPLSLRLALFLILSLSLHSRILQVRLTVLLTPCQRVNQAAGK